MSELVKLVSSKKWKTCNYSLHFANSWFPLTHLVSKLKPIFVRFPLLDSITTCETHSVSTPSPPAKPAPSPLHHHLWTRSVFATPSPSVKPVPSSRLHHHLRNPLRLLDSITTCTTSASSFLDSITTCETRFVFSTPSPPTKPFIPSIVNRPATYHRGRRAVISSRGHRAIHLFVARFSLVVAHSPSLSCPRVSCRRLRAIVIE